jgi:sec-independent protein translocase protein TatC
MDELRKKLAEYSPYLEDLFRRIYIVTASFIVFFIIGFFISIPTIQFFTHFFDFKDVTLTATSPFQVVDLAMNVAIFYGLIFFIPIFLYHFYTFIGTGLKRREKKLFFSLLPITLLLFLFGFAYGFFILYFTMETLASINISLGVQNLWDIGTFLSQMISTATWLGLIFEFPIIMTFLLKVGIIKISFLKKKRREAIFGMFLFTSLLPPTDGVSLLLMVAPLILLYEGTIAYNRSYRLVH